MKTGVEFSELDVIFSDLEPVCEFDSFSGWVNKARPWLAEFKPGQTIAVDAKGRWCRIGRDFMLARDENAFPVKVYTKKGTIPPIDMEKRMAIKASGA